MCLEICSAGQMPQNIPSPLKRRQMRSFYSSNATSCCRSHLRKEDSQKTLLAATTNELLRTQEHAMLISRSAQCRVAKFLTDLWMRLGKTTCLDIPMSHQDIADHLGLTIETVSRAITGLEQAGLVRRISPQKLILQNQLAFKQMLN